MYRKNGKVEKSDIWCKRLVASRRRRESKAARWRENKALLLGTEGVKGFKRGELVNLAWSAFQTMIGAVYAQNPRPIIREKKGDLQLTARMLTDIVVSDLEDMRSRQVVRLAMADVFWAGFGLVLEKLQSDVTSRVYRYTEAGEAESVNVPKDQRYSLHRMHPESVLFDPLASFPDLSDSMWIGLPFYPTKKELKEDPLLYVSEESLGAARVLSAPPTLSDDQYGGAKWQNPRNNEAYDGGASDDDDMAQVACVEVWDRVNKKKKYFIDGDDYLIGEEDWPVELRLNGELQFPCSMLYFNENPDELYPIPEISMIAPQLKQYSVLFRQILKNAVEKWQKFLVRGDLLQKGSVANLLEGEGNSIVTVDGAKVPGNLQLKLNDVVMPVPDVRVQQDVVAVSTLVKEIIHETVGAGDFASAGFRSTRSATEAAALSDFLRARMTTRTENIDAFFKQVVTKHVLYLQQTLTEPRAILTTDENGLAMWKQYTKADVIGTFQFSVIAGSSMPSNTETSRQENIAFFQQILPAVMQSGGNIRPFIDWIAPFYKVPQHLVDQSFSNHKQALQQLALLFAAIHAGAKVPGPQLIEAISLAVNTGLSPAELQQVSQQGAMAAQAQSQPGGLPGTNPAQQTVS